MRRGGVKRRQHAQRAYCRLKIGNEYQTKKTIAGPFRVGYGLSVWLYSGFCVGQGFLRGALAPGVFRSYLGRSLGPRHTPT